MVSVNGLKMILSPFSLLFLGCFMLFSCTTLNMKPVDDRPGKDAKSQMETALPQTAKRDVPSSETIIESANKNGVESEDSLNEKAPVTNETKLSENKDTPKAVAPPAPKPLLETDLFPKAELRKSSPSDSDEEPYTEFDSKEDEKEGDVTEEVLALLKESHNYWIKGDLDRALQMLDQAYALVLDTNGNPKIARQKDDLRLIIAKKILAIFNSVQSPTKGMRGEIPLIANADVEKEIRSFQTLERNFFISAYQRSLILRPVILSELKKAGLPDELSWLPLVESGFKTNALSSARALGLWQFISSTSYKYGLNRDYWIDERMDIEKSTKAAIAYLKDLHAMFGDWLTVLAAYNCGEGRVMRTISSQHINYLDRFWDLYHLLPNETARYVPRFLATLLIVKDLQKYGFDMLSEKHDLALSDYETVQTNRPMRLREIAAKLETSEEILCLLNAELRYKITPDRPYYLKVPRGLAEHLVRVVAEIPEVEPPRASYKTVRDAFIKHTVRSGETLGSIARKYNTSVNVLCSANRLSKKKTIYVGQRLKIPFRRGSQTTYTIKRAPTQNVSLYKVKKGDTLSAISREYGVSVAQLKKINNLKKDTLVVGQIIKIVEKTNTDKASAVYTVQKGDNLAVIARKKGVSLQKLLSLNKMSLSDTIKPGQEIIIQ